jgi:hypothetical protein
LWQSSPDVDLTKIGHTLREALQRFATELIEVHDPANADPDIQKTTKRLAAVVDVHRDRLGERKSELLDALIAYQAAVNGVIQRAEHADQKPGEPLTWDDLRSACFQTVNLMVEVDRVLSG